MSLNNSLLAWTVGDVKILQTDFLNRFADCGVEPESIDIVACTHLHFDHIGWNTRLRNGEWAPTFPNARYLFSKDE